MNDLIQPCLEALSVDFDGRFQLHDINWNIRPGEHWLITGCNGSGKSALAAVLAGEGDHLAGKVSALPERVALVSYEMQAELIEAERRKDDADILDVIAEGTPVEEIINAVCQDHALAQSLIDNFGLRDLWMSPSMGLTMHHRPCCNLIWLHWLGLFPWCSF